VIAEVALAAALDVGWGIPWAAGGPRIVNGQLIEQEPLWPEFPVSSVRLWDTRTAWLNLEPARGQYDWTNLDAHIAAAHAHGVTDITLVLWGTPDWAATTLSPEAAAWMGAGCASPPRDIADWETFAGQVAARYRGIITAYEIGNEANLRMFWNGTPEQYAQMVNVAAAAVRAADPDAVIVAGGPVLGGAVIQRHDFDFLPHLDTTHLDALSFHYYSAVRDTDELVRATAKVRKATGSRLPLWLTEINYYGHVGARLQGATERAAKEAGVARMFWYAYGAEASSGMETWTP
jgi:hypothetical protein